MKHFFFFIAILFCGCETAVEQKSTESLPPLVKFSSDSIQQIFKEKDLEGCFILYDLKHDHFSFYNEKRANQLFRPASTFKIPNSMIALETGVVKDENEMFKWDGQERFLKIWDKDHDLRSGFKYSVVWMYQHLAREIGEERMQIWVDSLGYGNKNIGGGIDRFWLNGDIRIMPKEQIYFLKKFHQEELPVSKRTMNIVKDIMIMEQTDDYIFRGKTGWDNTPEPNIGWFVGYLERDNNAYIFASNIDITNSDSRSHRVGIVKEVFRKMKLMD